MSNHKTVPALCGPPAALVFIVDTGAGLDECRGVAERARAQGLDVWSPSDVPEYGAPEVAEAVAEQLDAALRRASTVLLVGDGPPSVLAMIAGFRGVPCVRAELSQAVAS